jgi:hypothetical protein
LQTQLAERGTLSDGALAPLIGPLQRGRATGWLRLSGVQVRNGIPSVARVSLRLQVGRIVGVDADEDPLRPLPDAADLAERATAGLARILACRDGTYAWDPGTEGAPLDPSAPRLAALALRAVDRVDGAAVDAALGDTGRPLATVSSGDGVTALLTSSHHALMTLVHAGVRGGELIRSGGGDAAARDLLSLLCAGLVEWAPAKPAPPPTAPAPPPRPAAPESGPASTAAVRRDIEVAHAALRGANHFAVLGLTVRATEDEVRQAFARLARRYHPDAQRDPGLADMRPKVTELFVAVSNAYGVLKDAAARDRYERQMGLRDAVPRVVSAAREAEAYVSATSRAEESIESRILRAEEALAAHQPWEAIRLLEEAIPAASGPIKLQAQVLLGRAYSDRDRSREAEKIFLEVLQADSHYVPACLLLGRLYGERGMVKRACGMFERILEVDPSHPEARRELAGLREGPAPPPPGGSLLSRLRDRH